MAYTPTVWATGDTITAEKLNKAENGIAAASVDELPVVEAADQGKVLAVDSSGDWAASNLTFKYVIESTETDTPDRYELGATWADINAAYQKRPCYVRESAMPDQLPEDPILSVYPYADAMSGTTVYNVDVFDAANGAVVTYTAANESGKPTHDFS